MTGERERPEQEAARRAYELAAEEAATASQHEESAWWAWREAQDRLHAAKADLAAAHDRYSATIRPRASK